MDCEDFFIYMGGQQKITRLHLRNPVEHHFGQNSPARSPICSRQSIHEETCDPGGASLRVLVRQAWLVNQLQYETN